MDPVAAGVPAPRVKRVVHAHAALDELAVVGVQPPETERHSDEARRLRLFERRFTAWSPVVSHAVFIAELEARVEEERPHEAIREGPVRGRLDGELAYQTPLALGDEHLSGMSLHDRQAIDGVLIVNGVVDPPFCGTRRLQFGRLLS